ncbi:MAG: hypothetical protein CML02_02465 [Pseudooceanicola sp.]|nr:hypothetical protein [Pseudooceanicola sp.]
MHPLKALRKRANAVLAAAAIEIDVGGVPTLVTIASHPPTGGRFPQELLPAAFCYIRSETIQPDTTTSDDRSALLDVVVQAWGPHEDALDQVDDMHLAVELAIAADPTLAGLTYRLRPVGSEIYVDQGEIVFAGRRISFEGRMMVNRANPAVTS